MYVVDQGSLEQASDKEAFQNNGLLKMFFDPHEEKVAEAVKWEIWGTDFKDDGDDYTELRLFNANGIQIWTEK